MILYDAHMEFVRQLEVHQTGHYKFIAEGYSQEVCFQDSADITRSLKLVTIKDSILIHTVNTRYLLAFAKNKWAKLSNI